MFVKTGLIIWIKCQAGFDVIMYTRKQWKMSSAIWNTASYQLNTTAINLLLSIGNKFNWAAPSEKGTSSMRKMHRFVFIPRMRKVSSEHINSPLIHPVVSNDSVGGHRRPWSDCADAQADLGLCCPHLPEDTFSRIKAQVIVRTVSLNIESDRT